MSPVPLDARHIAAAEGGYVPQTGNIFSLEIAGLDGSDKDLITLSLIDLQPPKESNSVTEIPYGNEVRKLAGRAKVEAMELKVHDWVDRDTRGALMRWRRKVYDPATHIVGLPTVYKKIGDIILAAVDGTHQRVAKCTGIWPSDLDPGRLSQEDDKPVAITCTIQVDLCTWEI